MKKKGSVLICLLCVVFLVLGLAACDEVHKHMTCEICGLCTDTSCTGSTSEKCQGHNTGGDETGGEDPIIKDGLTYKLNDESRVATIIAADSSFNGDIPSKITRSSQGKEYSVTSIGDRAFSECSGLTSIQFSGTKSQWNAIYKGYSWNSDTGNYTITCSDGVINK